MTEPQLRDLARVLGDTVQVLPYTQTVKQADVLRPLIEQADAIAAVLPVELLAKLVTLADERPVLQSVAGRRFTGRTLHLADGQTEPEIAFEHLYWQQIVKLKLQTRRLYKKGEQRFSCSPKKKNFS
jgi:hypothetical protein